MKETKELTGELFAKEMNRKEFIQLAGMAIVALLGVNNFLTFLLKNSGERAGSHGQPGQGFGSSKFGV